MGWGLTGMDLEKNTQNLVGLTFEIQIMQMDVLESKKI